MKEEKRGKAAEKAAGRFSSFYFLTVNICKIRRVSYPDLYDVCIFLFFCDVQKVIGIDDIGAAFYLDALFLKPVQEEAHSGEYGSRTAFVNQAGVVSGFSGKRCTVLSGIVRIVLAQALIVHAGAEIIRNQDMVRDDAAHRIAGDLEFLTVSVEKESGQSGGVVRLVQRMAERDRCSVKNAFFQFFHGGLIAFVVVYVV